MTDNNLPDWLQAFADRAVVLLALDKWPMKIRLVRAPGGDPEREGHSIVNTRYLTAQIEINEIMTREGLQSTLLHELLHVALAPIEQSHLRVIELTPRKLRKHADELFSDGIEQTVEQLTRALLPVVQAEE